MPALLDFHMVPDHENGFRLEVFVQGSSRPLGASTFAHDAGVADLSGSRSHPGQRDSRERIDKAREAGVALYRKVFTPEIERSFREYRKKSDHLTIRIRIAREAEALEAAPWETMHDGEAFLAADARTGIVRLPLDIEPRGDLPALPAPVKMLSLASTPGGLSDAESLSIENELEILLRATDSTASSGLLNVEIEEDSRLEVIEESLKEGFQILHYAGYGAAAEDGGGLLLRDADGDMLPTSIDRFLQLFPPDRKDIRLAVISGCRGARAPLGENGGELSRALARRDTPAALFMRFPMLDRAARAFFDVLYPRLLEGLPADMAVSEGRRALLRAEDPGIQADAFAPTLVCGAGALFNTTKTAPGPRTGAKDRERNVHLPLPRPLYGFHGRRLECRVLKEALLHKDFRAAIIHGDQGVGKTALAARVAYEIKDRFDGVYAFDSRAAGFSPDIILLELNRFLTKSGNEILAFPKLRYSTPARQAARLVRALDEVRLLILFTNFESRLVLQNGRREIADDDQRVFFDAL
ncbi:MAG: CHAT domain-containing protein, partial [Desulfobacterales bacterium]|nr:CHAT domain-containing protein [Desulfobacterales bacterium]